MKRLALHAALAAALLLTAGCGSKGLSASTVALTTLDGRPVSRFGFGAEGGAQPSLLARAAGGFALAYVGTVPGNRHLHVATSADGRVWGEAVSLPAAEFSDASPVLVEDAAGELHLYFVSNRSGVSQQVFHCSLAGGAFGEPAPVPGLDGAQDLAATRVGEDVVLVAEVMGAGLLALRGKPGQALSALEPVAEAGAEPAICAMADGRVVVAFQREGKILTRLGKPGTWGDEVVAATGASRLRDPALGWVAGRGQLAWAERSGESMAIKVRGFDEKLTFGAVEAPGFGPGEARGAAWAASKDGVRLLAWGMKTSAGQQGVMVTTR